MKKIFYVFSIDYQLISHRKAVVQAAIQKGYNVTVVAQDTGYRKEIESMGAKFIDLPINRVGTNILEELKTFFFLFKLYKNHKPDLVHHISIKVVLWGALAARLAKVKNVVNAVNGLGVFFSTGEVDSLIKKIFMQLIRFSNNRKKCVTIFQNNEDKHFFLSNKALKESQIRIIRGSGVDLNEFKFSEPPLEFPLKIVFTSRMVKEKGVEDIINAAKLLKNKYFDKIQFLLCGLIETNPNAVSESYLQSECDGDYIQYLGHCTNIKDILSKSSIVLLPSYYREGIPKSLIEATAIGRPIITTNSVGCRETVEDGKNGFIVPIKSPEEIANKIEALVSNLDLIPKMGKESRLLSEKEFSIDIVIDKHLQIYSELINS